MDRGGFEKILLVQRQTKARAFLRFSGLFLHITPLILQSHYPDVFFCFMNLTDSNSIVSK